MKLPAAALLACVVVACGAPVGAPCEVSGSGFQRKDDCAGWCMAHWPVRCADGSSRTRAQCSGTKRCTSTTCGSSEVCYLGTNSFPVCVPNEWCPAWRAEDLR
jgi:hypothetical protein